MKPSQFRLALLGLALGVLFALLLAPQTYWLVRLQTLSSLRLYHLTNILSPRADAVGYYTTSEAADARRIQAAAAKNPDDFDLQYAQAVNNLDSARTVIALRALEARFPNKPALYANILRYGSNGLYWIRPEENVAARLPGYPQNFHSLPNTPGALAAFDRDAAAGERLDPNNAYFPIMRAVGLFIAHKDAEGMAAVARSGRASEWQEYVTEEVDARRRLHEIAFGDPGALSGSLIAYGTLLPQYSNLRPLARLLRYKAVQEERAGHYEEGLQIREDLRHYGDLMRAQSNSLISSLVAIAIAAIATDDPGGVESPKNESGLKPEQVAQHRLDAYCAYVTRIGHPEAAARARAEEEARREIQAVAGSSLLTALTTQFFRLTAWWLADLTALANILWLLVCGGLASGFGRARWANRSREGERRDAKAAVHHQAIPERQEAFLKIMAVIAMSGAAVFLLADFSLHLFDLPNWLGGMMHLIEEFCFLLAVFGLPAAVAVYLMRHGPRLPHLSRMPSLRGVGAALLAGLCVYGICALVWWQSGSLADFVNGARSLVQDESIAASPSPDMIRWLSLLAALAGPLFLALVLGLAARVRRVTVSVGFAQGFRAAALPIACVLLLVYGGLTLGTLRQERVVNDQVWHAAHDEGPYFASLAGQPWPGPVR